MVDWESSEEYGIESSWMRHFSSYFCQIFGIFYDFSRFCSALVRAFYFEKSSNMRLCHIILASKMKKSLIQPALNPFLHSTSKSRISGFTFGHSSVSPVMKFRVLNLCTNKYIFRYKNIWKLVKIFLALIIFLQNEYILKMILYSNFDFT